MSEHRTMPIIASRWQWHKTKDWIHFYFFVGAIPIALIIFYANVFIGPATLEEIPEGYTPQRWEYYRVRIYLENISGHILKPKLDEKLIL